MNVYPLFRKKFDNKPNNFQFKVIISFEDLSNRDTFIKQNENLKILEKFNLIPSIVVNLEKEKIINWYF